VPTVDLYCERLGPGLWAEPVNVVTNVAYFVAAWAVWRAGRPASFVETRTFAGLIAAIGLGSALFHTVATPWARLFDELPILVFELTYLWWYGRRLAALSRPVSAALAAGLAGAILAAKGFEDVLNGSLVYAPPLVAAAGLGLHHARSQTCERFSLLGATAILIVAVVLRTVDRLVCPAFPAGTHFLWHVLTATALYIFARGLTRNLR
jgi:hypothetical protein